VENIRAETGYVVFRHIETGGKKQPGAYCLGSG